MSVVANVAINVDSRNAVSKLREVQSQAGATERAIGGLGAAVGKLAVAFGALQAFKFVFAKTAELESQTRSLEVLTGSAEKAGQIIKELQQLGAVTPFTSTELIDSAKRLQAFGVEAENVVETTRRLADVSGATGAELQGLVTAYGQVQAKGRLQGEELLQFQERGVALQEELRKMYGLSGDEFQKALSKGRIGAEAVEVAIIRLTNAGGKYANGAIAQSDTLAGKFSTLQDGVDGLARVLGQTLSPVLKLLIDDITNLVNGFAQGLQNMQNNFNVFVANLRGKTTDELESQISQINKFIATNQQQLAKVTAGGQTEKQIQAKILELRKLRDSLQKDLDKKLGLVAPQGASTIMLKSQAAPPTPSLLAETGAKEKKGRQLSVNDLLGGDIQRQLQERQAQLEVATAREMNVAAGRVNAEQAKRMVESASKLLGIKYQIDAIDRTITARDQVREKIIASSRDKTYAALAFDEQTNDLKSARKNLERDIDKVMLEQLGKAEEQYRQEQQAIQDVLSGLDSEIIKIGAVSEAQKQAIQFIEIENKLKQQGIILSETDANKIREKIVEISKLTKAQEAANAKLQMEKDLYEGISNTVAGAFSGAIDAAVKGTENLGEALKGLATDLLGTIGKMLIMYGIAQALGALGGGADNPQGIFSFLAKGFGFKGAKDGAYWPGGFEAFADGGVVTKPTMGLIGEGGEAEYVIPASKMRGAMSRYSAGARGNSVIPGSGETATADNGAMTTAPIDVRYTVERINNVDYVTSDQFQRGMEQATRQGAALGKQQVYSELTNKRSLRSRLAV